MHNIPMLAFLRIHNFVGPISLYLGKEYFKEILNLKKTFIEKPVKFTFCKSTCYYRRSPHWPSRVRLDNDYFKRNIELSFKGKKYIGKNLRQAERIIKNSITKTICRPTNQQYGPYPYSDEVYNVTEIKAYNFTLKNNMERLKLYQNLWGKYT